MRDSPDPQLATGFDRSGKRRDAPRSWTPIRWSPHRRDYPLAVEPDARSPNFFNPDSLDLRVSPRVAAAVAAAAIDGGLARRPQDPRAVEARARDLVYEGSAVV